MIASWTQSQPNLAATSTGKQIAGISVLNHEDHCLLHVMMSTSSLMMVIDRTFLSRRCEVLVAFRTATASNELSS